MQLSASRLKSEALKAGYMQLLDDWASGKGQDVLKRRLDVAMREKTRYMANRIAKTELARAATDKTAERFLSDETIEVVEVRMNPNHPLPDICDLHAKANLYGLGPGLYPKHKAPKPPFHPHCFCKLVSRPDLDLEQLQEREEGAREYLRSLPPAEAARVLGSRENLQAVMNGADWEAVTQAGVRGEYWLKRVGDVRTNTHPGIEFVNSAITAPRIKQPPLVLSEVGETAILRAHALGVSLGGKSLALDHDSVRHILKTHGGESERKRGQHPISAADLAAWDQIFNAADLRPGDPPKARDGAALIGGVALLDGWVYGFAAKARRLHVVPHTLFKRQQK